MFYSSSSWPLQSAGTLPTILRSSSRQLANYNASLCPVSQLVPSVCEAVDPALASPPSQTKYSHRWLLTEPENLPLTWTSCNHKDERSRYSAGKRTGQGIRFRRLSPGLGIRPSPTRQRGDHRPSPRQPLIRKFLVCYHWAIRKY